LETSVEPAVIAPRARFPPCSWQVPVNRLAVISETFGSDCLTDDPITRQRQFDLTT
jgi:hypothetical protein